MGALDSKFHIFARVEEHDVKFLDNERPGEQDGIRIKHTSFLAYLQHRTDYIRMGRC